MKLKTLFKSKQEIRTGNVSGISDIDLMFKFFGLADRLRLIIETDTDGVFYAGDGSGEMSFKRLPDTTWFKWVPFDHQSDAEKIFNAQ